MAERGEELSERELAVLERLVEGGTNREIARDLDISHNTVKVHLRNVFTKLDVASRTEATTVALQRGLITVPGLEGHAPPAISEAPAEPAPGRAEGLPSPPVAAPPEAAPATRRSWLIAALLLLALLALFVAVPRLLDGESTGEDTSEAPAEPFAETRLGDTSWSLARQMPQGRAAMAVAAVGLNLYQIGGEVEAGVANLVSVYETATGRWFNAAPKPTAVAGASAAVLFGEIYVPGGRLADGRPTAVVEAYSPANDAWRPVAALPRPLADSLVISNGTALYVVGGWDGESYSAEALVYDAGQESWLALPPMSLARAQAAGGILHGRLYVVGGFDGLRELTECEFFDPAEEGWFACPAIELARAGAGAAALSNNQLYVLGGGLEGSVPFGEVFDAATNTWSRLEMPMLGDGASWYGLGVANVETRIYLMGGRLGHELVADTYVFTPFTHRTYLPAVGGDS
jgi:DNA-binding CsgD family transcriptional regulator/N-acetylneuraminic acid mutarotase